MERRVDELTYHCAVLDNADRKSNLLIEGVLEKREEKPVELATAILSKICPGISEHTLCDAYRVGPYDSNCRAILVTLMKSSKTKANLRDLMTPNIFVLMRTRIQ